LEVERKKLVGFRARVNWAALD